MRQAIGDNAHMDAHAQQILQNALGLPPDDRIEIADALMLSVDPALGADLDPAWADEIKRRLDEIDSGQAKMIPAEEVMRAMRDRLNG